MARPTPSHADLERALVSVPGVAEAQVTRVEATGKSRLRIRLANDEDAEAVSWAIAATLRERFGISLDPDQIRPRSGSTPVGDGDAATPAADGEAASPVADGDGATPEDTDGGGSERRSDPLLRSDPPGSDAADGSGDRALIEAGDPDASDQVAVSGDRVLLSDAARALLEDAVAEARRAEAVPQDDGPEIAGDPAVDATPTDGPTDPASARADVSATVTRLHSAVSPRDDGVRARIRHLDTRVRVSDVEVTATLAFGSREVTGSARSVATEQGILRAVAEATLHALSELTGDRLVAGIDSVAASVAGDPPIATVVVSLLTDRGDEALLGSSLVRNDPERAIMRATLDAVNRRVEPWLEIDLAG